MAVDPMFEDLNAEVLAIFAKYTPITYFFNSGAAVGTSITFNAIIDTPRDEDNTLRGTYIEVFVDGNSTAFPQPPVEGDMLTADDGSTYMVQYPSVDAVNGVYLLCRLKQRPLS